MHLDHLGEALDYSQKYLNKYLFHYILALILRQRPDLKEIVNVPAQATVAPHLYFEFGGANVKSSNQGNVVSELSFLRLYEYISMYICSIETYNLRFSYFFLFT